MSANKPNISQIEKYLNGQLDARAMHELERQALDDPFLADAIEGYAQNGIKPADLQDLNQRLQQRTKSKAKRIALWPAISIAASVLIFMSIGGWWVLNYRAATKAINVLPADKAAVVKKEPAPVVSAPPVSASEQPVLKPAIPKSRSNVLASDLLVGAPVSATEADKKKIDDLLKKASPVTVDSVTGTISFKGEQVARVQISGKDYTGGNTSKALSLMPAPMGAKLQLTDSNRLVFGGNTASTVAVKPSSLDSALVGKLAGVQVSQAKDEPGAAPQIRIRGAKSVVAGVDPLYVVDGVAVAKSPDLKPDDIASIDILKEAKATALYGSRAANGVIIITTKKAQLVTGQVVAEADGQPLPGVVMKVAGKNITAVTDANGRFTIGAKKDDVLNVRYVGFDSKDITVKEQQPLQIKLRERHDALAEVVVASYKAQKQVKEAHPVQGWEQYMQYLNSAVLPSNQAGTVKLSFIVNPNHTLSDFKVIQSLNPNADQQAINWVKNGPAWAPNINGKAQVVKVKVKFSSKK